MRSLPAIGVVLVACLFLAACGGSNDEAAPPQQPAPMETGAPTDGREQAPAIAGESLTGETLALRDLRGRPVLVNVWSSW